MSWNLPLRVFGVVAFGSLAAAPVYAPYYQKRLDAQFGAANYSFPKFNTLSVDEINRRTLKAAAAIKSAHR